MAMKGSTASYQRESAYLTKQIYTDGDGGFFYFYAGKRVYLTPSEQWARHRYDREHWRKTKIRVQARSVKWTSENASA